PNGTLFFDLKANGDEINGTLTFKSGEQSLVRSVSRLKGRRVVASARSLGVSVLLAFVLSAPFRQALAQPAQAAGFDVVSVKTNASGETMRWAITGQPGGRLLAPNVTLKILIQFAFRLPTSQIIGRPSWIELDHFDIEARSADRAGMISAEAMVPMIQSL